MVMVRSYFLVVASLSCVSAVSAGEWGQWRGPQRDGVAYNSPPLIDKLPDEGLKPLWISRIDIPAGGNGGWGSPVAADGRVYVFAHVTNQVTQGELPPLKYPGLSEEQRQKMSEEELQEYDENHREE